MLSTAEIYESYRKELNKVLSLFEKAEEKDLHFTALPDTWSSEHIFRHLLASVYWMLGFLPGEKLEPPAIALHEGKPSEEQVELEELKKLLNEKTAIVKKRMEKLTPEKETEIIEIWWGEVPRQTSIVGLLQHDHAHLGQIIWLLKRSTGWTDKEIYNMEE